MNVAADQIPLRRVVLLFFCQAFYWITVIVGVAFSGLIGLQLASHQALATVPMATLTLGNIVATLPLSLFMQRYSRRSGFMIGAIAMIAGGLLSVYAITQTSFWWFCAANILLGVAQASAFYYRLAAADGVAVAQRGRALAWVLSGGVVAAVLAPSIGLSTKDLFLPNEYVGSFYVVAALGALTAIVVLLLPQEQHGQYENVSGSIVENTQSHDYATYHRPLKDIITQPQFVVALSNAAVGHGVMILMMVATPLAILACGFSVENSTSVIQWHVLGMFLPAFFSGRLIDYYGVKRIALTGIILLLFSVAIALVNQQLLNFYSALFLLGVGWNFLYLSGSTKMTSCHHPQERGKVQGFAELVIAIVGALAAFGSGALLTLGGWSAINAVAMALLLALFGLNLVFSKT